MNSSNLTIIDLFQKQILIYIVTETYLPFNFRRRKKTDKYKKISKSEIIHTYLFS